VDKSPIWWQFIRDTIGIPVVFGFVVGIPAMIGFVITIWDALSNEKRILVCFCALLILIAVGLYIWGRTRKVLYKIPPLLYQMEYRCEELSHNLKFSIRQHLIALTLVDGLPSKVGVTINELLAASDGEFDNLMARPANKAMIKELSQVVLNPASSNRIVTFYEKSSGIEDLLRQDKQYCALNKKLEHLKTIVPTQEITEYINHHLEVVKACACFPFLAGNIMNTAEIWPLKSIIDLSITISVLKDNRAMSLARIREAIGKYYKGT